MIGIIDYGAGNLHSVVKALKFLGYQTRLVTEDNDFKEVDKLILPGVGAFGQAVADLRAKGLWTALNNWVREGLPLLGICLGMQLLMESSQESPGIGGLGLIKGACVRLRAPKVPHMGWNDVRFFDSISLFDGIADRSCFYFVHSYYVSPEDSKVVRGVTEHHLAFPSVIQVGRVIGVQFHPEKSGEQGLFFLRNWVEKCCG